MPKPLPQTDVLVLGSHPSCYLAAALLQDAKINVMHATIPDQPAPDRLVLINPKFFELHKLTATLKKNASPMQRLKFLADDGTTSSEYDAKSVCAYVGDYEQICDAMVEQARRAKINLVEPKSIEIRGLDEKGVDVAIDGTSIRPRMLIVGGELPSPQRKLLGLPVAWDAGVLHRYTFLRLKSAKWIDAAQQQTIPISLDLAGQLHWAWLLARENEVQLAVVQPIESIQKSSPAKLLEHWIDVLTKHHSLKAGPKPIDTSGMQSIDLPLAGALAQEGVANRTLLIGPAGGFYTACAEDIYSNCWSATFAVEVAVKALKERHLQDALGAYRQTWGSSLGDYLRGPHENLRFLLPLVYRNSVMTARMGEAILRGESVVR
ncbi:MAG TPA: hypothetical protein VHS31_01235 [Tepidisphaeraceae bacterium]|jgi:flavin-dependent dehydrogenase|nr:hypothetical protein [Tepidisphaeraceae bacterium]